MYSSYSRQAAHRKRKTNWRLEWIFFALAVICNTVVVLAVNFCIDTVSWSRRKLFVEKSNGRNCRRLFMATSFRLRNMTIAHFFHPGILSLRALAVMLYVLLFKLLGVRSCSVRDTEKSICSTTLWPHPENDKSASHEMTSLAAASAKKKEHVVQN